MIPDRPPTVSAGPDASGAEGAPVLPRGSAHDLEGTPVTSWSYVAGPDVDPGATCSFSTGRAVTSVTCSDDGTFTLTLTASDGVNASVSDSAMLTLSNQIPALQLAGPQPGAVHALAEPVRPSGPEPWSVYRAGSAVALQAPFEDPGSNDTQTCRVVWDDGQVENYAARDRSCDRVHVYTRPGMFTVQLTVTDDDTGSDMSTTMVIVYDPDGGFATAGAHLDSQVGALATEPDAEGRLSVQLNPGYRPHDEGPAPGRGKVQARLTGTAFELESTALEWLVVTSDDKVAVKGTATVGGVPGYGFVAYGFDQADDALRLVVWPLSAGEFPGLDTLYDNRREGGYDLDLSDPQPLAGGSVQTHQN